VSKENLMAAARDELFSHINRCGVLQANAEDQSSWMDETIDYIGERYPDLTAADLQDLHTVGMRFCQPTIDNINKPADETGEPEPVRTADENGETVTAGVGAESGDDAEV